MVFICWDTIHKKFHIITEKTLVMLYKGGKKDPQSYINHNIEDNGKKDGLKQLFIGTNGILIHSGQMVCINK